MKGFLADTNIFLEILLGQPKRNIAKKVIVNLSSTGVLYVSDFTVHTIGIKIWHPKKNPLSNDDRKRVWDGFLNDINASIPVLTLPSSKLTKVGDVIVKYGLDFDDAYQVAVALEYDLDIISEDPDFKVLKNGKKPAAYDLNDMTKILSLKIS